MKRRTVAILMISLVLIGIAVQLAAQTQNVYRYSTQSRAWEQSRSDEEFVPGTRLFNPSPREVRLTLGGDTVLLGPFTEVTIGSIRTAQTPTTLQVPSGSIRAQVRTASPQERGVRFQIQSPVATASVRGTQFQFGSSFLNVQSGDVELQNLLGQSHSVRANQKSQAFVQEPIQSVEVRLRQETRVE